MGLLPAAHVAKRLRTIRSIVTCVTITFAQNLVTSKSMQNLGRNIRVARIEPFKKLGGQIG